MFDIPNNIQEIIDKEASKYPLNLLKERSFKLSEKYLNNQKDNKSFFEDEADVVCYALMRFPATFNSVSKSLKYTFDIFPPSNIKSALDIGGGFGTAAISLNTFFSSVPTQVIEREEKMVSLGEKIKGTLPISFKKDDFLSTSFEKADLVILSYSVNEIKDVDLLSFLDKVFDATNQLLLIVDPGTPSSFKRIKMIKEYLHNKGMFVVSPCLNSEGKCHLKEDDWCHFSTRVNRNKLQKYLKGGDAPYEDEKFSFLALSKEPIKNNYSFRILRHPLIGSNSIKFVGCFNDVVKEETIYKKDKEMFKKIKKSDTGDAF